MNLYRRHISLLFAATLGLAAQAGDSPEAEYLLHRFERLHLTTEFYSEGATFGDVSGDGVADIISGPYWYQGPDFRVRHEIYSQKPFSIERYSNNFFAFIYDFNRDSWNDVLVVGFPGQDASWFENPQKTSGSWRRHRVFDHVDNESPEFTDLTGDGKPELVCCTAGQFGYAAPDWKSPEKKWTFFAVSKGRRAGKFTHGLGVGDVNGDGRNDILEKDGWYEQPPSLAGAPLWKYHPYPFAPGRGGAQMYAYDFDGDGDNDVLTSLNAHGWGLLWHENRSANGKVSFVRHMIMGAKRSDSPYGVKFSQPHAIDLVDMDGDGVRDIVTGKRYWAHMGKDPGGREASVLYWFRTVRRAERGVDFVPRLIDDTAGVGTQVVAGDVDGDGRPDVVVGNKKGTFLLRQRVRSVTREEWLRERPRRAVRSGQPAGEAALNMVVPDGFRVSVVAAEPAVRQPIAFTMDDRGRLWVVEGYSYPRRRPDAQARDRILILSDSNGDGKFDQRKVFADKLNLVSGIEVGFGGVWVGAAPYLLYIPDKDGDDHADGEPQVLLDGWGYQDTHETLNSFTWGPDGWLYGLHGVFTHSRVGKPGTPDDQRVPLNAGVWRYHPTRHKFEVFAWGTSNPWGLDFNDHGQAVITACVIPHLYHVIQGARYQRQSGRHFNPYVYDDIKTVADHLHHAGKRWTAEHADVSDAFGGGHAHCGAMVYLGDSFPASYRGKVFMSNLHGRRINVDSLQPRGSGYVGRHEADFLQANDQWFMGITLKYGPSGSVFLSDWYDKQTCHQRLPEAWDRSNGRIYKISYGESPESRPKPRKIDLGQLSSHELVRLQLHENDWFVRHARRILQERGPDEEVHRQLVDLLESETTTERRLRALWALHGAGGASDRFLTGLLDDRDPWLRAWAIHLIVEDRDATAAQLAKLAGMAREDAAKNVRLYLAAALQRLSLNDRRGIARGLVRRGEDAQDHNLPLMIWYGVEPLVATDPHFGMELASAARVERLTRYITRRIAENTRNLEPIMAALGASEGAEQLLLILDEMLKAFRGRVDIPMPKGWNRAYERLVATEDPEILERVQEIAVKFGDRRVFSLLRERLADRGQSRGRRMHALRVLLDGGDREVVPILYQLLADSHFRGRALRGLAKFAAPDTPAMILKHFPSFSAAERMDAINTLVSRPEYARELLEAVRHKKIAATEISAFSVRQIHAFDDPELQKLVAEVWGDVRPSSAEARKVIEQYKSRFTPAYLAKGDPAAGRQVFAKTCASCHTLFGAGGKIGPDLTGSNRKNVDYVLENMLDPSAVVGKDYQLNVLVLDDGSIRSGLIVRETDSAITLQEINGKVVVPKRRIVKNERTNASMMPKDLVKNLKDEEFRDLIVYLRSPSQVPLRGTPLIIDGRTHRAAGVLEGEKLKVLKVTGGNARPQNMAGFGRDKWSGNTQLWWTGAKPGQRLTLAVPVKQDGKYRVEVALTRAVDYGVVQFRWDGERVEAPIDLFNRGVIPTGNIVLGEFSVDRGKHRLGVEIIGANPDAVKAYMFGLDYLYMKRVE